MDSSNAGAASQGRAFTRTAVFLHWSTGLALAGMLALGWYMTWIEDQPGSDWYFDLHKSLGLLLALLIVLRWCWRVLHRPLPYPRSMLRWQVRAAKVSHLLLYGTMLAMPLLGLAGADLSEDGLAFFGRSIGQPLGVHKLASELLFSLHSGAAWLLVALVTLHVAAALLHLRVYRDGVFERMAFGASHRT